MENDDLANVYLPLNAQRAGKVQGRCREGAGKVRAECSQRRLRTGESQCRGPLVSNCRSPIARLASWIRTQTAQNFKSDKEDYTIGRGLGIYCTQFQTRGALAAKGQRRPRAGLCQYKSR
jgi:hypothetical protein